jgi:3-hydroxybutyryl-CoA dehydrogenase
MGNQIKSVGIVGAGQMGGGIAHVCAMAGYDVYVTTFPPIRFRKCSRHHQRQSRPPGRLRQDHRNRTGSGSRAHQLRVRHEWPGSHGSVIEAATEDETVKRKIYQQICPQLNPEAILATNTSSLSITRLASATDRPERFIGIHFMNPVPVMKLVELVRGIATEDLTFKAARGFIESLDKTITVAEDFPPSSSTASCCR